MTRSVLAKDPDEPICDPCAKALGARPKDKQATVSPAECCLCDEARPCMAIRDWHWSATSTAEAMRDWQRPL